MENNANVITRDSIFFNELISKIKTMEKEINLMEDNNLSCMERWLTGEAVMKKLGIRYVWHKEKTLLLHSINFITNANRRYQ